MKKTVAITRISAVTTVKCTIHDAYAQHAKKW